MNKLFSSLAVLLAFPASSFAQGIWTQKASLTGLERTFSVGFAIGNKAYVGTGQGYSVYRNDFWAWHPATNAWTQKADFGGAPRYAAVGFSIGGKGYVGTGVGMNNTFGDFWEYDTLTNSWTTKMNFGGTARYSAVGFSIGSKGYIGTGSDTLSGGMYRNDFWEYNPSADTWTQKANYAGSPRTGAAGFSIGTKGYILTGVDSLGALTDLWEYDQLGNTWTQKTNFPGSARYFATCLSIGTKGYLGLGGVFTFNDWWEWDQATDTWSQKANFPATARGGSVGLSIGMSGYVGFGGHIVDSIFDDWWEFSNLVGVHEKDKNIRILIFPNPASNFLKIETNEKQSLVFRIFDITGRQLIHQQFREKEVIDVTKFVKGIFFIKICDEEEVIYHTQRILIN